MVSLTSGAVAGFLFFAISWFALALIFGFRGLRDGSLRIADSETEVVFRQRTSGRIGSAMLGVWIAVGVPLEYGQGLINAVQRHQSVPEWAYFALLIGVLMGAGFGGLCLYHAGPRDLYLDPDRRTYRFVSGWPLFPRVQVGPWEDMAGVCVRPVGTRSQVQYFVEIAWTQKRLCCPQLGRFGNRDREQR